jgi:hypothetical protein
MYYPLLFANNSFFFKFYPLTATGMALYIKMLQNVKIYFAYTETKWNLLYLILRLSGIEFRLISDLGESD